MKALVFFLCSLALPLHALEVHEWGTFTSLSGPDGIPVRWYQAGQDLAALPDFILRTGGKTGTAITRMETPVIYFYPERPGRIEVKATFANGWISETYPFAANPVATRGLPVCWKGALHPPDDAAALDLVPEILHSHPTEPYGAAREVPDAWLFVSDEAEHPLKPGQVLGSQAEKFIFYRGAGDSYPALTANLPNETSIRFNNLTQEAIPAATVLQVRGKQARWTRIPAIPAQQDSPAPELEFSGSFRPLDEVEAELAERWITTLARQGLTRNEAAAMVKTWRATWFREPGTRVLSIVPRAFVDRILPLEISPEPEHLERVFVARHEIITRNDIQALVDILNTEEPDTASYRRLEFGRFASGAATIATGTHVARMLERFQLLHNGGSAR